jgi:hypothetical protein
VTRAELLEALLVERFSPIPAHTGTLAERIALARRREWLASMHDPDRKDPR